MATYLFVLPTLAMALFSLVWVLAGLLALRLDWRAREHQRHGALELRNARGLRLLKDWLSPAQLQFGSDSRTIYRIHHGVQANIEQLDTFGQTVCAWCFAPEGDLVPGDVMLAQKSALEADERAAIDVAVKYATLRVRRVTCGGLSCLVY